MNRDSFGVAVPRRSHRIVGPMPQHAEQRHWTLATVLTAVAIGVAVAGAGVTAYAASEAAANQRRAAKMEEKWREAEAESARQSAAFEEKQHRRRLGLLLGKQEAIYAASGDDPSSGSPFLTYLDTVKQGELEALNIRRGGDVAAAGFDMEARMARLRGSFAASNAGIATGGLVSAGGQSSSILSGWARAGSTPTYSGGAY